MKKYNKRGFFEGWYFKHQYENLNIAFIPGINIDKSGIKYSFIQVITDNNSYYIKYDYNDFSSSKDKLNVKIKNNIFTEKGVIIDIVHKDIVINGELNYEYITPIKYDIMGPFSLLPFMECNHGVISLNHKVNGKLNINNEELIIKDGNGYIEKDWGSSFPKSYLWIQSNDFKEGKASIMVSIADIPLSKFKFKGCIAVVFYEGKEYRLSTYNGVRILSYNENGLIIKRGKYKLEIEIKENYAQKLLAPNYGEMIRTVYENISCKAKFKFYIKDTKLFELKSDNTSFEYVI
ncbi:tocopherol cyclase family protein [Clostridium sp.]|uniref:tocopherol cyclase family protein n=1 Tax=Clostridium sp. TaxID=1506 RepID=UPI00260E4FB3|nr:tocopherol cyclase family protein [Clostridium sp.]